MSPWLSIALSLAMLAAGGLIWAGIVAIRKGPASRIKGILMVVAAIVLIGNVYLLSTASVTPVSPATYQDPKLP
jgi:hypothetical protein